MSSTIAAIAIVTLVDGANFFKIDSAIFIAIPVNVIVGAKFRFTARDQEIMCASAHLHREQLLLLLQFLLLLLQARNSRSLQKIERTHAQVLICVMSNKESVF